MRAYRSSLFGNKPFRTQCFPPPPGRTWSTKDREQLRAVMGEHCIRRALVPHAAFNGLVVEPECGRDELLLDAEHVRAMSKAPLEGYELQPGEALISAAGGCMFIAALGKTVRGTMRMIASHAGRDSLIDRGRIEGKVARRYEGVVHAIVAAFGRWGIPPKQLELFGFYPLEAAVFTHRLDHPEYGSFNAAMLEDLQTRWGPRTAYLVADEDGVERSVALSLRQLFLAQARTLGILHASCEGAIGPGSIFAHTRHADPRMRDKRNLVIIQRTE